MEGIPYSRNKSIDSWVRYHKTRFPDINEEDGFPVWKRQVAIPNHQIRSGLISTMAAHKTEN